MTTKQMEKMSFADLQQNLSFAIAKNDESLVDKIRKAIKRKNRGYAFSTYKLASR